MCRRPKALALWACSSACSFGMDSRRERVTGKQRRPTRHTQHKPHAFPLRLQCHNRPMRFFNTEGPIRPDDHYAIPPLSRMDVDDLLELVNGTRYFVMHAPRQTGKTSALIALRDLLNSGEVGAFRCVDVNVEVGQVARDDVAEGMRAILGSLASSAHGLATTFRATSGPICSPRWAPTTPSRSCSIVGATPIGCRWCCWWTRSTRWSATRCSPCCASCAPATRDGRTASPRASCCAAYGIFPCEGQAP